MLTSKQRAKLRSMATSIEPILQVGKSGINDPLLTQVNDALKAREIMKITVLETAPEPAAQIATELAERTKSEVVQVIGRKIVLYKRNEKKPIIDLTEKKKNRF